MTLTPGPNTISRFWKLPHTTSCTRFPRIGKHAEHWYAYIFVGDSTHAGTGLTQSAACSAAMAKMEARHD